MRIEEEHVHEVIAGDTELSSELTMRVEKYKEIEDKKRKGRQEEVRGAGDVTAGCCSSSSC